MHPNSPDYDKKCSLRHPESQPSPSGDYEKEAREFDLAIWMVHDPQTRWKMTADWLRSHDAKVGQAEQRLKKSLLDMLHNHGCESGPCNACKSARAALQESPSDK